MTSTPTKREQKGDTQANKRAALEAKIGRADMGPPFRHSDATMGPPFPSRLASPQFALRRAKGTVPKSLLPSSSRPLPIGGSSAATGPSAIPPSKSGRPTSSGKPPSAASQAQACTGIPRHIHTHTGPPRRLWQGTRTPRRVKLNRLTPRQDHCTNAKNSGNMQVRCTHRRANAVTTKPGIIETKFPSNRTSTTSSPM